MKNNLGADQFQFWHGHSLNQISVNYKPDFHCIRRKRYYIRERAHYIEIRMQYY